MSKKYSIIYADPPWPHKSGSRIKVVPYPVMKIQSILNLSVSDITSQNAVLFLWTTDKYLQEALQVMKNWGFQYRTIAFNWVKTTANEKIAKMVGGWTVKSTEICLLGVKGKPHSLIKTRKGVHQLVIAPRKNHSEKPMIVRKRIECMFSSSLPKIELFARKRFSNWDAWGNEIRSDIKL